MNIYALFRVDWTVQGGEYRTLIDVYRHFKDADEAREVLFDEEGCVNAESGTDFEVEEKELK